VRRSWYAGACLVVALATAQPVAASVLKLTNIRWNLSVTVEVRVGKNIDCSLNDGLQTYNLALNQSAFIQASGGGEVCWRRQLDPDKPNGQWGPWSRKSMPDNNSLFDEYVQ
jgi:hypothetical protein